jgi:hypothetical protein
MAEQQRQAIVRCVACGRPAPAPAQADVNLPGYVGTLYFCDPPCEEFRQRLRAEGVWSDDGGAADEKP